MPVSDDYAAEREAMVREQITARGITEGRVLDALRRVPRHRFLPAGTRPDRAYADSPQPIGEGQTISQPYIVALMTQALALQGHETVLEIGAGSGYQTAVLAALVSRVVAVERHAALADRARKTLALIGVANVELHTGDGSGGWAASAPYDAILCAAVAPQVPDAMKAQLAPGGRLVLPVGGENAVQELMLITRLHDGAGFTQTSLGQVAFVPLIGASGFGLPDDLGAGDI